MAERGREKAVFISSSQFQNANRNLQMLEADIDIFKYHDYFNTFMPILLKI